MSLKVETENDTEKLKARQDGSICNPITEEAGECPLVQGQLGHSESGYRVRQGLK